MLFCDMVVAVCICEVVESDFCLSSGFGVLVMCLRNCLTYMEWTVIWTCSVI